MHICICDDETSQHEIIKNYIKTFPVLPQNPEITSRFSGSELANDCIAGVLYDILFIDVRLGSMNGLEVAETVRRLNPNAISFSFPTIRNMFLMCSVLKRCTLSLSR